MRKAFCFHVKSAVESRAIILPRDRGTQIQQFALGKAAAQRLIQWIIDVCRCARKLHGELQNQLFVFVEMRAWFEIRKRA